MVACQKKGFEIRLNLRQNNCTTEETKSKQHLQFMQILIIPKLVQYFKATHICKNNTVTCFCYFYQHGHSEEKIR